MAAGRDGELRIGLTISGAIALGAFEGGALAALLAAALGVNARRPDALRIDAMAGASAGSMTAVLAARTLLAGLNPIDVMYEAWVKTPQLSSLRDGGKAPLAVDGTKASAKALLDATGDQAAQTTPVRLNMALGCLRGLQYKIGRIGGPPVDASTYLDWEELEIDPTWSADSYMAANGPVDAALASGAHAAAFRPRGLDRSADDVQAAYEDNGIYDFPPSKFLWYTDGGTIDNEPLGRALEMTQQLDTAPDTPLADASRLHLMITPDPAMPHAGDDPWSTAKPNPTWAITGLRTLKLVRSQHLYDDLRELEKTNSRIAWTRLLEQGLAPLLSGERTDVQNALQQVIDEITSQKALLMEPTSAPVPAPAADSAVGRKLREALDLATGFGHKHYVAVAVVSPLVLPEVADGTKPSRELLAGAFLGHFGGFLDERLRENDFALGYRCMLRWLDDDQGLERHGLDQELSRKAVDAVHSAQSAWEEHNGREWITDLGGSTLANRPLRQKLAVLRLALRSAVIAFNDVRRG